MIEGKQLEFSNFTLLVGGYCTKRHFGYTTCNII